MWIIKTIKERDGKFSVVAINERLGYMKILGIFDSLKDSIRSSNLFKSVLNKATVELNNHVCPECQEWREDDDRVKNRMKCFYCAY